MVKDKTVDDDLTFVAQTTSLGEKIIIVGNKIKIEIESEGWLKLYVPWNKRSWIAIVKNIIGRKWIMEKSYWRVPNVKQSYRVLKRNIGMKHLSFSFIISANIPDQYFLGHKKYFKKEDKTTIFQKLNKEQNAAILALEEVLILERLSFSTLKSYKYHLADFFYFYKTKAPEKLEKEELKKYLLYKIKFKKIAESTQNQIINAVKAYWERVLKREKEAIKIKRPKLAKKLPNVFSTNEVINLLNSIANLKHKLLILLIYSAGLRRSEALKLLVRDINIERRSIHVKGGKGKRDRYVALAETVIPYLKSYLRQYQPQRWLFEGQFGGQYAPSSLQKIFRNALEKSQGNPYATLHTLRHSYATHCMEQGQSLKHVQAALGHSSIKTTEIYLHLTSDALRNLKSPLDRLQLRKDDEK